MLDLWEFTAEFTYEIQNTVEICAQTFTANGQTLKGKLLLHKSPCRKYFIEKLMEYWNLFKCKRTEIYVSGGNTILRPVWYITHISLAYRVSTKLERDNQFCSVLSVISPEDDEIKNKNLMWKLYHNIIVVVLSQNIAVFGRTVCTWKRTRKYRVLCCVQPQNKTVLQRNARQIEIFG